MIPVDWMTFDCHCQLLTSLAVARTGLTESSDSPSNAKLLAQEGHRIDSWSASLNRSLSEICDSKVKNSFSATPPPVAVAYREGSNPDRSVFRLPWRPLAY